jgi:ribosomal protein L24E
MGRLQFELEVELFCGVGFERGIGILFLERWVWVWLDGCVSLDGRRKLHRGRGARERASGETEQLFARVRDPRRASWRGPIHRRHRVRRGLRTNGDTRRHCNNAYKTRTGMERGFGWWEETRWVGMAILISPPRGCLGRGSGSTIGKSPKSHWTDRCGNSAVEAQRGNHAKTLGVFRDVAAGCSCPRTLSPYRARAMRPTLAPSESNRPS